MRSNGLHIAQIEVKLDALNGAQLVIEQDPQSELAFSFPYELAVGLADILCQNRSGEWLFDKYEQRGFSHSQR